MRWRLMVLALGAFVVAAASFGFGLLPGASAATSQFFYSQTCLPDGRLQVKFDWTGKDPTARQQWLDLSLSNNDWQSGTFLGAGPLSSVTQTLTWPGLLQGQTHYVRVNQQIGENAWDPSPTFYFMTGICASGPGTTPQEPPPSDRVRILAPIESASVSPASLPGRYVLTGKAGLPGGCAQPDAFDVSRTGTVIHVQVYDSLPAGNPVCTQIYGIYDYTVGLGEDLLPGTQYRVEVNDKVVYFTTDAESDIPAAPTNLQISGRLPDLNVQVPPGEGEAGRITVSWQDNSDNESGFRIYNDCAGTVSQLAEGDANETSLGPLQSCRPGRVGVSAFNASGESAIVWTP